MVTGFPVVKCFYPGKPPAGGAAAHCHSIATSQASAWRDACFGSTFRSFLIMLAFVKAKSDATGTHAGV